MHRRPVPTSRYRFQPFPTSYCPCRRPSRLPCRSSCAGALEEGGAGPAVARLACNRRRSSLRTPAISPPRGASPPQQQPPPSPRRCRFPSRGPTPSRALPSPRRCGPTLAPSDAPRCHARARLGCSDVDWDLGLGRGEERGQGEEEGPSQ